MSPPDITGHWTAGIEIISRSSASSCKVIKGKVMKGPAGKFTVWRCAWACRRAVAQSVAGGRATMGGLLNTAAYLSC